jgi:hypothetical protein
MTVLERDPDGEDDLVSWWDFDEGLEPDTELVVEGDEEVVFWHDGPVLQLGPGRHRLNGDDHPALDEYISDDEAPAVRVAFVRTSNFTLPFDGPIGDLRDPETGLAVGLVVGCESMQLRVNVSTRVLDRVFADDDEGDLLAWVAKVALRAARDQIAAAPPPARAMVDDGVEVDVGPLAGAINPLLGEVGMSVEFEGPLVVSLKDEDADTVRRSLQSTR